MATAVDLIAIARDIVQETCLNFPILNPEWIAQRRDVFVAASAVKEMCEIVNDDDIANGEELEEDVTDDESDHDAPNLLLYCALVVEYAANFLAKYSPKEMSNPMGILNEMESIKDTLKNMESRYDIRTCKDGLIDVLACDLGMDHMRVSQSIESSFQRHSGGPQKAQDFIERSANWDRHDRIHVANLRQFLNENSVSLLALRSKPALDFLDILEQAARRDSVATPDEKQHYQTYLRRLSCRSGQHPSTFHLRNVKTFPSDYKRCDHSSPGKKLEPQRSLDGGYGQVRRADWTKPDETVVKVAIKTFTDPDVAMFCHEAAFWFYLDPDKVVPFYGVAKVENSPCLVSRWMEGGPICCYVDGKEDSIRFDLLHQVADGIKYLHDLNYVHCDIKPENILICTQQPQPKALITDFGFSNAARRTNVAYSRPFGFTPGFVNDGGNIAHWDPSNDIYAFGVTCCQVVLVNKRRHIASIPKDIKTCMSKLTNLQPVLEDSDGEGSKDPHQQTIQTLCQKFFPNRKSHLPFIHEICRLVTLTCSIPTCSMDVVVDLLNKASGLKPDTK